MAGVGRGANPMKSVLAALLALVAVSAAAQTFVDTTQVVVVEVPVQVIRNGEPVRGLTAADFEVWDGREKQTLTGFEAMDLAELSGEALATADLPVSARRHFLILFDLTFSAPEALIKGRKAAQDMMGVLHPTDLVAVATWSVRQGPRIVLGFSSDRRQIAAALRTLGYSDLLGNQPPDPLGLSLVDGPAGGNIEGGMRATADAAAETAALVARLAEEAQLNQRLRCGAGHERGHGGVRPRDRRHHGAQARGLPVGRVRCRAAAGDHGRPPPPRAVGNGGFRRDLELQLQRDVR